MEDRSVEDTITNVPVQQFLPVTVVIPVRNEIESIDDLLTGIRSQVIPPAAVIVVDAGSTDGTREALRRWSADWQALSVIEVEQAYPGVGRNLGTDAAQTDWIAYIDGGTKPHPGWLLALWEGVQGVDIVAGYGMYQPFLGTRMARWFALAVLPAAVPDQTGLMRNHFIACSIVRKTAWDAVGGFPPWRAAEDRIFMQAVNKVGRYVTIPQAAIDWIGPQTFRQIWRRTALLAEHGARAGRAKDWHLPTLRYWLIAAAIFSAVPCAWALPLVVGGWFLRTLRRLSRHKYEVALARHSVLDFFACAYVLLIVDLAMYVGWWRGVMIADPTIASSPQPAGKPR